VTARPVKQQRRLKAAGQTFALAREDHELLSGGMQMWDVGANPPRAGAVLFHRNERIVSVAFRPDGKAIALARGHGDVELWELAAREPRLAASIFGQPYTGLPLVEQIAFGRGGKLLAVATREETRLYDLAGQKPQLRATIRPLDHAPEAMAFLPEEPALALLSDMVNPPVVRFFDVTANPPRQRSTATLKFPDRWRLTVSRDGRTLATASSSDSFHVWELGGGQPRLKAELFGHKEPDLIDLAPDGRSAATAGYRETVARLWDLDAEKLKTKALLDGHEGGVSTIAFSPDGSRLATGTHRGRLALWDAASGRRLAEWDLSEPIVEVRFAPDGQDLAAAVNTRLLILRLDAAGKQGPAQ
jgi:WD40 repeat protein